jgi:hypothetical protein
MRDSSISDAGCLDDAGGPVKELRQYLGSNEFLLSDYVSDKNTAMLFPLSDADAAASPLVRRSYEADLHLAIGNLKQFDATKNGAPGALPCCDFFSTTGEIIQGAGLLDVWGPLWFVVAREVLPILVPELGEAFCNAMNAADINAVMLRHVIWCASICVHLFFHT